MIFDTHAHYDDEAFDGDRPELLGRLKEAGVGAVMNVAASLGSCRSTLKLAEAYDWIYGAMGVHPSETGELDQEGLQWIKEQCGLLCLWIWKNISFLTAGVMIRKEVQQDMTEYRLG